VFKVLFAIGLVLLVLSLGVFDMPQLICVSESENGQLFTACAVDWQ
jgi:hypothetical protein